MIDRAIVSCCLLFAINAYASAAEIDFPGGRVALSRTGNNYDKDNGVASVINLALLRDSTSSNLRRLFSRNVKSKYDSSDWSTLWWVITGAKNDGSENPGWQDDQPVLESLPQEVAQKPQQESGKAARAGAASYYHEAGGLVVIEAENTTSDLGKWERKTAALKNPHCGEGYLEFAGNNPRSGPAESPLTYAFKIQNGGLYRIHLHCARETIDGRKDLANDCYVRLEGDLGAGPNSGNRHGNDAPLEMLQSDTKFFGGDDRKFVWSTGNRLDPGGHNNKRVAVYNLKAGETYTLVVSGRSQKFKLDRILFRHDSISAKVAQQMQIPESKRIKSQSRAAEEKL